MHRRQGSIAVKSGNIFMKKGSGSRQFSGMKMRCMQKDARSRGRLCRRNAMDFCPVFGFVSAMAGWGNGRWRRCIMKWQGYSDRRMHRCGRIGSILRKGHKKKQPQGRLRLQACESTRRKKEGNLIMSRMVRFVYDGSFLF